MNVRCPSCEAVYRVDPAKVPQVGIRARCGSCATVIAIQAPNTSPAAKAEVAPAAPTGGPELVRDRPEPPTEPVPPPPAPRLSRPFTQPRPDIGGVPSPSPVPRRPSAPVFRPTPGMPITQPVAPEPPQPPPQAEPDVPASTTVAEPEPSPVELATPTPAPAPTAATTTTTTTQPRRPVNPFLSKDPSQKARRLARALVSDMIVYQPKKRQEALHDGNLKTAFEQEIKKSWGEYVDQVGEDVANSTPYFTEALNDILAGGQKIF